MYQALTKSQSCAADEELVDVLTAISVVSMRLARKLTLSTSCSQGGRAQTDAAECFCTGHQSHLERAKLNGFAGIQPMLELPEIGVSNAILSDPFGYVWMLHQVHREVSFEERSKLWDEKLKSEASVNEENS